MAISVECRFFTENSTSTKWFWFGLKLPENRPSYTLTGLNDVGNRVGTATRSQSAAKPADNAIVIAEDQALAPLVYQAPATQANVPSHGTARLPKGGHLRL